MYTYMQLCALLFFRIIFATASPDLTLSIPQLQPWRRTNMTTFYKYNFARKSTILDCVLSTRTKHEGTYKLKFYVDGNKERASKVIFLDTFEEKIKVNITLKEESKNVTCTAEIVTPVATTLLLRNEVILKYEPTISLPTLSISGPPQLEKDESSSNNITQIYNYNFYDGQSVAFDCTLKYPEGSEVYDLSFYMGNTRIEFEGSKTSSIKHTFTLQKEHDVIRCLANNTGTDFPEYLINIIHLHCVRPLVPEISSLSTTSSNSLRGWVIWALGGCAALFTICVAICTVLLKRKKPSAIDADYANLAKDQNYQTMPDPRVLKPGVGQKENYYCEIKDSQDPNTVYAEPNRNGQTNTYAEPYEPYTKHTYAEPYATNSESYANNSNAPNSKSYANNSKSYATDSNPYANNSKSIAPNSDSYANNSTLNAKDSKLYANNSESFATNFKVYSKPYAANSEAHAQPCAAISETYAKLYAPNSETYAEVYAARAPYATTIPKAQRKKNEYSNVFGNQYGNTKK